MQNIQFIDLQAQYKKYKEEIDAAIHQILDTSSYIMGPTVKKLEEELSAFTGSPHSLTCSSGTDALLLPLMAIDIQPGDEIITTPFTFIATVEVISLLRARPVFVDIDNDTYNIDVKKIEKAITSKTKAIMPVSLYGQPADMDEINELGRKHNILIIEDACQSFGATYKDKKSCNLSTVGCTSFYPAKPLGCYGDGGAVFTKDSELADKMSKIRVHGQKETYLHEYVGINGRFDAIQAAIVRVKLKYFAEEVAKRQEIAARYNKGFSGSTIISPVVKPDRTSIYAQYSVRVKNRSELMPKLKEAGVPTAVHYPIPIHLQPVYKDLVYANKGDLPISEKVSEEIMSLPMHPFLEEEKQDYIIKTLKENVA